MSNPPNAFARFWAWAGLLFLAAVGLAWASLQVQRVFAPVLLLPVLEGALLGGCARVARIACIAWPRAQLATVALAALLLVGSQHYLAYRQWAASPQSIRIEAGASSALAEIAVPALAPQAGSWRRYVAEALNRGRAVGPWIVRGTCIWYLRALEAVLVIGTGLLIANAGRHPQRGRHA